MFSSNSYGHSFAEAAHGSFHQLLAPRARAIHLKEKRPRARAPPSLGLQFERPMAAGDPMQPRNDEQPDISQLSPEALNSELALACSGRSHFSAHALLLAGACANSFDSSGSPALLIAAWDGRAAAVAALLAHGASARARNQMGMTPLMAAARSGSAACAALLLDGSDPLSTDHFGLTALMAASSAQSPDCCALLAPHSDRQAVSNMGLTAFCIAAANGSLACAKILMPSPREAARRQELSSGQALAESSGHQAIASLALQALRSMDDLAELDAECLPCAGESEAHRL